MLILFLCFQYKSWVSTDRATLVTNELSATEFVDEFFEKLEALKIHNHIAKCQAKFYREMKENVGYEEIVVAGDFAENYSFVIQVYS